MKLHYYAETDSPYIELSERPSAETREIAEGVNIDLDGDGAIVGLDIDGASTKLDLTRTRLSPCQRKPVEPPEPRESSSFGTGATLDRRVVMRGGGGNTRFIPGGRRRPMAN
jgi:uncharacterized protein YuzE